MLFDDLKVGDVVAIDGRAHLDRGSVTHVTEKRFCVGSLTFRRVDGEMLGADKWRRVWAKPQDDPSVRDRLAALDRAARLRRAVVALQSAEPDVQTKVCELLGV